MDAGVIESGPLMDALVSAQVRDAACTRHPRISSIGRALIALVHELGDPLVWPAGSPAERVIGAAVILSEGKIEARDWSSSIDGRDVLIFATHLVSALPLELAAEQARRLGAGRVFACALDVRSSDPINVDGFALLRAEPLHLPDVEAALAR